MYQEVCFNRGTEAGGGGVNVGHSIAQPPQSFYACYGACNLNNKAQNELMTSRIRVLFLNFF